jgi:mannosyltransferase OCH1-like enzyme
MSNLKSFLYTSGKEYLLKREEADNRLRIPYPLKSNYNIVIPTNIFQTWHTKTLPPLMAKSIERIIKLNPRFKYHLYDDNDCREFIKNYFKPDVLFAYDNLIPGAYKADLWRYCILFIYGGIYLDIKYKPLNNFKFVNLTEKQHLVADINNIDIYNAVMVCFPKTEFLYKSIRKIVENVQTKFYGNNPLEPTGPALLSKFISTNDDIVDLKHQELDNNSNYKVIYYNNIPILKSYNGHLNEVNNFSKRKHYSILWNEKNIYS